jgi:hypothetical protein
MQKEMKTKLGSSTKKEEEKLRAKRTDENHKEIRELFRELGAQVKDTSRFGEGFPDLLVKRMGKIFYIEIKKDKKEKLTKAEKEFSEFIGDENYHIVCNREDVMRLLNV